MQIVLRQDNRSSHDVNVKAIAGMDAQGAKKTGKLACLFDRGIEFPQTMEAGPSPATALDRSQPDTSGPGCLMYLVVMASAA
jgi:hypothetical protein